MQYETFSQKDLEDGSKKISKLNSTHHIEWGDGNAYTLVCEDEDYRQIFERHIDPIIGVTPLTKTLHTYITIGLDHKIHVCKSSGGNLSSLNGHTGRILGVFELQFNQLLSVSEDGTLRLWNIKIGAEIAVMDVKVNRFDAISFFDNTKHFTVNEMDRVTIWSFSGQKIAEMDGLKAKIHSANRLKNGNWLVSYDQSSGGYRVKPHPAIWNESGEQISVFGFDFDVFGDVCELQNNQMLIKQGEDLISLWDMSGKLIACHETDPEISNLFQSLKSNYIQTENHIERHPEIIDYAHIRNPISSYNNVFMARGEIETQDIDLNDPIRNLFWNFFNRPLFNPIKTALKEPIKNSRSAIENIKEKTEKTQDELAKHIKKRKRSYIVSSLWLFITVIFTIASYAFFIKNPIAIDLLTMILTNVEREKAFESFDSLMGIGGGCASITLLFFLISFGSNRSNKSEQLKKEGNLALISQIEPAFEKLIANIKSYRNGLLKTIPIVQNPQIFSDNTVPQKIQKIIEGELEILALEECGIDREDIIYTDNSSIILKDWALIQNVEKRKEVISKININNEQSFWAANGEMLFAAQYIQYIFLTEDKIDVFTTYYDFISGKCIGKEANAFYYKDVTNIAKREVERHLDGKGVSATEITLAVASGEKIQLTIQNNESVTTLVNSAKDNESLPLPELIDLKKQERKRIEEDESMLEDEKQEEIKYIDGELNNLRSGAAEQDITQSINKADEAIKNIRAQLRQHKKQIDTLVEL